MTLQPVRILLVEDEKAHVALMCDAFERAAEPFGVTVASNLSEAREALARETPDLIIADWRLPDGDGDALLQDTDPRYGPPLVVISSQGSEEVAVDALKRGAVDYWVKGSELLTETPRFAKAALRQWEQILARRDAEDALVESERLYREAIRAGRGVPYRLPLNSDVYDFVGDGVVDLFGVPADEFTPRHFRAMIQETRTEGAPYEETLAAFRRGELDTLRVDHRIVTPTGEEKWISDCATPVRDPSTGAVVASLGIIQDITERMRASQALEESERLFRSIFEETSDGIAYSDVHGNIVMWNPAAERTLGFRPDEVIGRPVWEVQARLMHPEQRTEGYEERLRRSVERYLQTGELQQRPNGRRERVVEVKGKRRVIHETPFRLETAAGPIVGGVFRDVTAQHDAQEMVAQSERLHRLAIEAAHGVPYRRSFSDKRYDFIGEGIAALIGIPANKLSPGQFESMIIESRVADPDAPQDLRQYTEQFKEGAIPRYRVDHLVRTAWGELRWLSDSATRLADPVTGKHIGSLGILTDITDRKRTEEALRASEVRYRNLVESMADGLLAMDDAGIIQYANPALGRMLEVEPDDLRGADALSYCEEFSRECLAEWIRSSCSADEHREFELALVSRSGRQIPVVFHAGRTTDAEGRCTGSFAVVKDITERKRAEAAQRLSAVGQLAAGVAHEFNNLLAIISGRAQLAIGTGDPLAYEKLADVALKATERGADICTNLTSFARPQVPKKSAVAVEDALDAALNMASRELQNAGLEVRRIYTTGRERLAGDIGQLEQVFLNLIINACHATPAGGSLELRTFCEQNTAGESEIVVRITDTGIGIPPEHLPRIFEPFFTTKGSLGGGDLPGSGLGLSVSHGIVEAHGGTIAVDSEVGVGTTFELRFRALADGTEGESSPAPQAAVAEPENQQIRVLLADDEPDLCELLSDALSERGCTVVSVGGTQEALQALARDQFDVVLCDLLMPDGGGRAVLEAARELDSPPPVVIITGRAENEIAASLLAEGASACLRKPFSISELVATLSSCGLGA
ncbi:MAG: PAS domain S-box protein [Armatimonadetes bacterium]|nr:PAS domain S-box protein [Armatimonadota bacterium]